MPVVNCTIFILTVFLLKHELEPHYMLCENSKGSNSFPGDLLLSRREVSSQDTAWIYNKVVTRILLIHSKRKNPDRLWWLSSAWYCNCLHLSYCGSILYFGQTKQGIRHLKLLCFEGNLCRCLEIRSANSTWPCSPIDTTGDLRVSQIWKIQHKDHGHKAVHCLLGGLPAGWPFIRRKLSGVWIVQSG